MQKEYMHQLFLRRDLIHKKSKARLNALGWEFADIMGNYWVFERIELHDEEEYENY